MTQLTIQQVPRNGIGGYALPDEYIQQLEQQELSDFYQDGGISNLKPITDRLADFGRFGDDAIAHVEKGELVVPYKLFEKNPELKESIFSHLREMGIEDPERYVVGSEVNSINPETGLPEFFLGKIFKAVSKPFKAAAKVVKKVAKVFKKLAPIVLPIALSMTPLGPYGAALGSGIGSLMNGGSLKDAFKSALIAGGTSALFSGVQGAMSKVPGETFATGFKGAIDPAGRLTSFGQALKAVPEKGIGTLFTGGKLYNPKSAAKFNTSPAQVKADALGQNTTITGVGDTIPLAGQGGVSPTTNIAQGDSLNFADSVGSQNLVKEPGLFDKAGDYFFRGGQSKLDVIKAQDLAGQQYLQEIPKHLQTEAGYNAARASAGPGIIAKYGPSAALAAGAAVAGGAFKVPEPEESELGLANQPSGAELLEQDPEKFGLPASAFLQQTAQGPFGVGTDFPFTPTSSSQTNPFLLAQGTQIAATGGEIYPRRIGGIMPDEGIPNEDSVRALLTPGEFVMTTDAVKGLGNGNSRRGINNMYSLMNNLENKGRMIS
jgi:hypothetical protein